MTALVALGVALLATPFGSGELDPRDLAVFALAGLFGPGVSQLLFTLAVRDAGLRAHRSSSAPHR